MKVNQNLLKSGGGWISIICVNLSEFGLKFNNNKGRCLSSLAYRLLHIAHILIPS